MNNKNQMQDMIPPEKRSIRRVPLSNSARNSGTKPAEEPSTENGAEHEPKAENSNNLPPRPLQPREMYRKRGKSWKIISLVVLVLVVVFIVMNMFGGATVNVVSQREDITIDGTFTANTEPALDTLAYEMFTVTREASETVEASGSETVQAKASGTIIVFNDYSEGAQLLIENTRFRTPAGLVYRIQEPITVPGQTVNDEGETVPGSIEARVVADEPGEKYNIGLSDFDIPAFEESGDFERFEGFFARSKTLMTGGFDGTRKILNEQDAKTARERIDGKLKGELESALESELPKGFVVYDDAVFMTFRDLPQEDAQEENKAVLKRSGTLHAVAFDSGELAKFVGFNAVAAYDGSDVLLSDASRISFSMVDKDSFDPTAPGEFEFTLSGQDSIIWQFDEERLRNDLAGKSKSDITMVMSAYPAIQEADVVLTPFWRRSLPEDIEDIKVKYSDST